MKHSILRVFTPVLVAALSLQIALPASVFAQTLNTGDALKTLITPAAGVSEKVRNLDWDPTKRPPIRNGILECNVYLSPAEPTVNQVVGIPLNTANVEDFKNTIAEVIKTRGKDVVLGSYFYVTGTTMKNEAMTRLKYQAALEDLGIPKGAVKVKVLSIPQQEINWLSVEAARGVYERIRFWMPSLRRDYVPPTWEEVSSGLVATAAIEAPQVWILMNDLPPLDAALTISTHAIVLGAYDVFKKTMGNWLFRPGSSVAASYAKQLSLSLPFILNYNILSNTTKIATFYENNGLAGMAAAFPNEVLDFAATQSVTMFLQTLFYQVVVTNGFRKWENDQIGVENSNIARPLVNYLLIPVLAIDSIAVGMASGMSQEIFSLGPLEINSGHAALFGLIMGGGALFKYFPRFLDPTIDMYRAVNNGMNRFGVWFKESTGIDIKKTLTKAFKKKQKENPASGSTTEDAQIIDDQANSNGAE